MGYVFSLCASFALGVALLPVIIRVARRMGWFDRIDGRKIHTGNIPRIGGVALYLGIVAGAFVGLAAVAGADSTLHVRILQWVGLGVGLSAMFAVGLVDDFANIPAMRKLIGQLVAASVIAASGFRIGSALIPFSGSALSLGLFSYPLTVFWIVAIANAVNLIDGMDGFAGGVIMLASATFAAIGAIQQNLVFIVLSLAVFGASAAFLLYNRPPAHIFMGDSGSLFLGTLVAVIPLVPGVLAAQGTPAPVNLLVPATVLLVPIFDTAWAIFRRVRRHMPIHQADNEHLHHKLLNLLGSTRGVLSVLYLYQVVLGVLAVLSVYFTPIFAGALLTSAWVITGLIMATTQTYYLRIVDKKPLDARPTGPAILDDKRSREAI